MLRLQSLKRISIAHPTQWEAVTDDGRPVYIRYKWGELSISVGPVGAGYDEAVGGETLLDIDVGHHHDCDMTWDEFVAVTRIELVGAPCPTR